jgi:hypothetical protein
MSLKCKNDRKLEVLLSPHSLFATQTGALCDERDCGCEVVKCLPILQPFEQSLFETFRRENLYPSEGEETHRLGIW